MSEKSSFVLIWLPEKLQDQVMILKKMEGTDGSVPLLSVKPVRTFLLPVPLACGRATEWLLCSRVNFFNWLHIIAPQTNGFSRIFRPPLISLTLFYLRERSDPTGLSDYRALHQSAIEAETPLPLCCQPVQMAALSLDWEIKPGPRMHKN